MTVELKVKVKTLAAEARIIRKEENRLLDAAHRGERKPTRAERRAIVRLHNGNQRPGDVEKKAAWDARLMKNREPLDCTLARKKYTSLHLHRTKDLRREARATHLARAFLRLADPARVDPALSSASKSVKEGLAKEVARMAYRYGDYRGGRAGEQYPLALVEVEKLVYAWMGISEGEG